MEENSCYSHKIYKNDTLLLKSYIGKEVNVTTEDDDRYTGVVYTVDPVSESVVLLDPEELKRLKIIFGHAIKKIEVNSENALELATLFTNEENLLQSTINERKATVMRILKENRFDVREENDVLMIENILSLNPPYKTDNCVCSNSIILGRIQSLLSRCEVEN